MRFEVITSSSEETEDLASVLAESLSVPSIILLDGDLAAGKTTFVRGFARGFGSSDDTSSPTFTILNIYDSPRGRINHFDLYRIGSQDELYAIGFDEYLEDAITLIEWPEVAGEELRERADIIVKIENLDSNKRRFTFEGKDCADFDLLFSSRGGQNE